MFITKLLSTCTAATMFVPLVHCTNVVRSAKPTTDGITYPTKGASFVADGETSTIRWYVTSNDGAGPQSYDIDLIKGISNTLVDNLSTGFTSDGAGENSADWYVSTKYAYGFDYKLKIQYNSTFTLVSDTFSIYGSHNNTIGLNETGPSSLSSTLPAGGTVTATVTATSAPSGQAPPSVNINPLTTVITPVSPLRVTSSSYPSSTHTSGNAAQTTNSDNPTTTSTTVSSSSSLTTATLAGAVAGAIGSILLLVGFIFYLVRRYGCSCVVTRKERRMSTRIRSNQLSPPITWDDRPPTVEELALSVHRLNIAEVHGDSSSRQELDSDMYVNEKAASVVKHVSMQDQMQIQASRRMTERWELEGEV